MSMDRILIVLMGSLGDVARGFSILPPLKNRYPGSHITWLVEPKCLGIVNLHPLVDDIIVFDRNRGPADIPRLTQELRKKPFDVVLDLQRHAKSGFFSRLAPAKRRIGFHPADTKEFNHLFHSEYIDKAAQGLSKVQHYQKFIEKLGIQPPEEPSFGLADLSVELPMVLSEDKTYVGVVLGSSWESKDIPLQGYQKLIQLVLAEKADLNILLLGDKSHVAIGATLEEHFSDERIVNLAGRSSLKQLIGLLKHCSVAVGPDSGPGHICSTVGTPYVGIFGPTDPRRVAPHSSEHLVVQTGIGCAPCWKRKCPGLDKLCMRLVSLGEVAAKVLDCAERR